MRACSYPVEVPGQSGVDLMGWVVRKGSRFYVMVTGRHQGAPRHQRGGHLTRAQAAAALADFLVATRPCGEPALWDGRCYRHAKTEELATKPIRQTTALNGWRQIDVATDWSALDPDRPGDDGLRPLDQSCFHSGHPIVAARTNLRRDRRYCSRTCHNRAGAKAGRLRVKARKAEAQTISA
jgi:hypothetical protein